MKAKFKCKVQSSMSNIEHRTLNSQKGLALVVAIMIMVVLLSLTGAALLFSGLNLKTAGNFKTGTAALNAADMGINHARERIKKAVKDEGSTFTKLLQGLASGFPCASPCNGTTNKPTLTGSLPNYTYSVVVEDDADCLGATTDGNDRVIIIATSSGPNGSKRAIKGYVTRAASTWFITGNDTNYTDSNSDGFADSFSAGPNPSVLGFGAGTQALVDRIKDSLSNADRANVQGLNYDSTPCPKTPSVGIPSGSTLNVQQLATDLINQIPVGSPCPPKCSSGLVMEETSCLDKPSPCFVCPSSSPCTLGTDSSPQITHLVGEDVRLKGYIRGAGVLVVDGKTKIDKNFEFHGIVIHVQTAGTMPLDEGKFDFKGNAKLYGTVLLGQNDQELELSVKGGLTAAIRYSSQAIQIAKTAWPTILGSFNARAAVYIPGDTNLSKTKLSNDPKLIAWHELMQ